MARRAPVERPPVTLASPLLYADRVGAVVRVVTVARALSSQPNELRSTHARVVSVRPLRVDLCGVVVPCRVDGEVDPRRVVRPLDTQGDQRDGEGGVHRADSLRTGCAAVESER